jgi:hypothetical protein
MARLLALLAALAALSSSARAQHIEYVGKVGASLRSGPARRPVGDPRYVAITPLLYDVDDAAVEVLDLDRYAVDRIATTRAEMIKHFGRNDPQLGWAIPPSGSVVLRTPSVVGLFLEEHALRTGSNGRRWYAEIDARTGAVRRSVPLGDVPHGQWMEFTGTDAARRQAWWVLTRPKKEAVLRRLDLDTLRVTDVAVIPLQARNSGSGYESHYFQHAARDFSRFAIVEYFEDGLHMQPGKIYVIDPAGGGHFAVPAPSTAYGLAFTADGRYMYLGSNQHGTVSRVNLATRKTDRTIAGPKYLHHLVLSPDGKSLFALASSRKYAVFDLDLRKRRDREHVAEVAPAADQLFGGGVATAGGYFVLEDALPPVGSAKAAGFSGDYVIARLID